MPTPAAKAESSNGSATNPYAQAVESILRDIMHGTMFFTGLRGTGKSWLAAQFDDPYNIAYYDFDDGKNRALHKMLDFGLYHDMRALATKAHGPRVKPAQSLPIFHDKLSELPAGRFTVAVLDNIKPLEDALLTEVKRDPAAFGIEAVRAQTGRFGGAWPGVNELISGYISMLHSKGVRVIIAIAHVKAPWAAGGTVPNKWRPLGVDRWQQASILTLTLVQGEYRPNPAAIVFKEQLGIMRFNRETRKHEPVRRLPLRLPRATFEDICGYLDNPADLKNPAPGEVPTDEEMSMFGEKYSHEQLRYMMLAASAAEREEQQQRERERETMQQLNQIAAQAAAASASAAASLSDDEKTALREKIETKQTTLKAEAEKHKMTTAQLAVVLDL